MKGGVHTGTDSMVCRNVRDAQMRGELEGGKLVAGLGGFWWVPVLSFGLWHPVQNISSSLSPWPLSHFSRLMSGILPPLLLCVLCPGLFLLSSPLHCSQLLTYRLTIFDV